MTTAKVKAPIGYHFMVRERDNDFYLMRTIGRYVKHEAGEYISSLTIDVEVKGSHSSASTPSATTQRRSTATSTSGTTTTVRTTPTTRTTTVRTPSSGSSSSGSSSSGGGY